MMVVDTHCHASSRWYEPVDTLLFNMDRCGVDKAVLVQMLGSTDSAGMQAACRAHADRFVFIGAVDPQAADPVRAVEQAAESGAAGLRLRAAWRAGGEDPLAPWRAAERAGLRVSLVGPVASFTDGRLAEVAAACPRLPILLEHLGGLARPDAGDRDAALPALCDLARYPNIAVKLPGLGQLAPRLPDLDAAPVPLDLHGVRPLLDAVLRAFTPQRLMWGSDFPPVAAREGYANALEWTRALLAEHWPDAVGPCMGETARTIFRL